MRLVKMKKAQTAIGLQKARTFGAGRCKSVKDAPCKNPKDADSNWTVEGQKPSVQADVDL